MNSFENLDKISKKNIIKNHPDLGNKLKIDNNLKDLQEEINKDCSVQIITKGSKEGLEIIRHDAAHVMAEAVQDLFPETLVSIGPIIDDGFYYDFDYKKSFTPEDFIKIEKRMLKIVKEKKPFIREVWSKKKAMDYFKKNNEKYKIELIQNIDNSEEITIYKHCDWVDLCRGPHSPSTGYIG